MTAPADVAPDATVEPGEVADDQGGVMHVRFPVLALEGKDSGDGRFITPGGLSHRALPMSLLAQPYAAHGGQEPPAAEVVGRITTLTRRPGPEVVSPTTGEPFGPDVFVWSGEGEVDADHQWAHLVRKGYLRGVSIDTAAMDAELIAEDDAEFAEHPGRRVIMHTAEIAAATLVPVPAFADAYMELADPDAPGPVKAGGLPEGLMASAVPSWRSADIGDECGLCLAGEDVGAMVTRTEGGSVSAKSRRSSQEKGHTMKDGSFPIDNADDLSNAIQSVGRAKDPAAARRHIIAQAKRLGLESRIPDGWNTDGSVTAAGALARDIGIPDVPQNCQYGQHAAVRSLVFNDGLRYVPVCGAHEQWAHEKIQGEDGHARRVVEIGQPGDDQRVGW